MVINQSKYAEKYYWSVEFSVRAEIQLLSIYVHKYLGVKVLTVVQFPDSMNAKSERFINM